MLTEQTIHDPQLAHVLSRHQAEIATRWIAQLTDFPRTHNRPIDLEHLVTQTLEALVMRVSTGSPAKINQLLTTEYITHLCQACDLGQVLDILLRGKEVIAPFIWHTHNTEQAPTLELLTRLDMHLRDIAGRLSRCFIQVTRQQLQEQQQQAVLMLDVTHSSNDSPQLDQVLQRVAERIAAAVGVHDCNIYLMDHEQGLFIPRATTEPWASTCPSSFHTYPLDPARDRLFHELVTDMHPVVCFNAQTDARISRETRHHLGLKSLLITPIRVNGPLLGAVLVGTCDDYRTFTSAEIEMVRGIAGAVALAIENDRLYAETRRRLAESQSLQRVTAALLQKLDLDEVLEIVCSQAQQLTGALGSTVFLVQEEGWLWRALSTGLAAPISDRIPVDGTLTGLAVQQRAPVLINEHDALGQPSCCWGPELITLLAVPLHVSEGVIGTLNVVNKPGGFSAEDVRIMSLFADQAAIAIENARLSQQVEHLAVMEERQRLARELHDSVTQALYSVTLHSEAAVRLLTAGNSSAAVDYLRDLRDMAQQALREMRLLIFELRPPILEQEGLVAALQARLDAVEARAGLQTELRVVGEEQLPYAVAEALYRIAQEALNNVLKHAHAQRVTVHLHCTDPLCWLEVCDDGKGFDLTTVLEHGGWGLRGMQERAQRMSGELTIESVPDQGTTIRVTVEHRTGRTTRHMFGIHEEPVRKPGEKLVYD